MSVLTRDELEGVEKTVRKLVKSRNVAREKKRFDVADEIRSALDDLGVVVQDTSGTTSTWRWKETPQVDEVKKKKSKKRTIAQVEEKEEKPAEEKEEATKPVEKKVKVPTLKLDNGVVAKILGQGEGAVAKRFSRITVKYAGVLASTKRRFDAGKIRFKLGAREVIKGWDVGCEGMKVGEKRRLTIPPAMGYGARGAPPDIPKNATLIFDVALLKVE